MKRIFLFIVTNIAIMVMISFVFFILSLFGIHIDGDTMTGSLLISAVVGFTGAFISLALSKTLAVRSVGATVIKEPKTQTEMYLFQTVERLAMQWKIKTPEIAIYNSPEPNAFATGARKNHSLIAVSTGLLNHLNKDEVEAVLGHEMAHIGNGDMVTMTLIQGVVNTFVFFFARIVAKIVAQNVRSEMSGVVYFITSMAFQIIFGMLASVIVMWFSRQREYRADAGAAKYVGALKMIAALKRLHNGESANLPQNLNAMGIAGGGDSLFSTHPSLENRIKHLQNHMY